MKRNLLLYLFIVLGLVVYAQTEVLPADFPKYEDRGNLEADRLRFYEARNRYAEANPEVYKKLKAWVAEGKLSESALEIDLPQNKPSNPALQPTGTAEKWRIIHISHSAQVRHFEETFRNTYFAENAEYLLYSNGVYQLLFNDTNVLQSTYNQQAKLIVFKLANPDSQRSIAFEIAEAGDTRMEWRIPSDISGDEGFFSIQLEKVK